MTPILPNLTLESGKQPQHSIIWLHGLGADGHDFVSMADELKLPVAVRYIFPHAPQRPVTINGGFVMRAWYDIAHPNIDALQDAAGIRQSQLSLEALIAQEVGRGIAPANIFLAGFSQGGAIVLHTALRQNVALGGVIALSTYLPLAEQALGAITPAARKIPAFFGHGRYDAIVPLLLSAASKDTLKHLGLTVEWHEYPMQHSLCEQEIRDIESWLTKRLLKSTLP